MSETKIPAPGRKRGRREPKVFVAHHVYPQPEDVRREDVLRAGRLLWELLHRDQDERPQ